MSNEILESVSENFISSMVDDESIYKHQTAEDNKTIFDGYFLKHRSLGVIPESPIFAGACLQANSGLTPTVNPTNRLQAGSYLRAFGG